MNGIAVVSKKHPINAAYRRTSVTSPNGLTKQTRAALTDMVAAARKQGVRILVRSGYRSYALQAQILASKIREYGSETLARRYNAAPGRSEHQTGLAVDLWDGVTWGVVGESVTEQGTVDNIERLFIAAKGAGMPVFISPHYYYPHDHRWQFEGTLEKTMHAIGMFDRPGPLNLDNFQGSGADWMPQYKQYIEDGETVICSPHKVYSPAQNDLNLQLRKRGIDKVILAGMSANLCTQAHLYELLELGFEVAVVRDATAGAKVPEGDGYLAALINFRMVANGVWWTDDAVTRIAQSA